MKRIWTILIGMVLLTGCGRAAVPAAEAAPTAEVVATLVPAAVTPAPTAEAAQILISAETIPTPTPMATPVPTPDNLEYTSAQSS